MGNDLKAKVAYLKGLAEGAGVQSDTKEGKVLIGVLGVLEDMADTFESFWDNQESLEEYLDSMDSDLAKLEDDFYGEDEEDFVELDCPVCGETVCIDPDLLDEEEDLELVCPGCGEVIDLDGLDELDDLMGDEDEDDDLPGPETTDD